MALTANRELSRYVDTELRSLPVAAGVHIHKGALVGLERTSGAVRSLQPGDQFAGIAYEEIDNTHGGAADKSIRVYTQGDFILPTNMAIANQVGAPVYAMDDEQTTVIPAQGASLCGVVLSVIGPNLGIVRILPIGSQLQEMAVQSPIVGSTTETLMNPVMIVQRRIHIVSVEVSFLQVPDQGNLDLGTTLASPDDVIDSFDLTLPAANSPALLFPVKRTVDAGLVLWARVGQAALSAGEGGLLSVRYVELP